MKKAAAPLDRAARPIGLACPSRAFFGSFCLTALLSAVPLAAAAAESPADVETDHLDAFDDLGPRSFGALGGGYAAGFRSSGTGFGTELDIALGDTAALSVGAAWLPREASGYSVSVGLPLFPGRVPFHGLCVHPRITWLRLAIPGEPASLASMGATVGWEFTWRPGFTMRLGVGAEYEQPLGGDIDFTLGRVEPVFDSAVGWAF